MLARESGRVCRPRRHDLCEISPIAPGRARGRLGHFAQRPEGIGISRLAGPHCIHTIGALSPEGSDGLLGGWLDHFEIGAKPRDLSRWQDAMRSDPSAISRTDAMGRTALHVAAEGR
ncbi:MAG: hypothetical protein OXP11_21225 [Gammaproteobacteria bacterium]|nr:hypothetical protein [Gammaproteobacteria bacterium]